MRDHIIVCGDDALARRIIDELNKDELRVVPLQSPTALEAAGIATARAVIAASPDDSVNLEVALLARQANPTVRVVARLSNSVLQEALADGNGPGAVINVADLTAPSVVEALLGRSTHTIAVAGEEFVVSGNAAPRDATLRELYGQLVPVAVLCGDDSPTPGEVIACPRRDAAVQAGDWTIMTGTRAELAAQGIEVAEPLPMTPTHRSRVTRTADALRALRHDAHPMFFRALGALLALLIGSTIMLRFAYQTEEMNWLNALYLATETITTTGYGDYTLLDQPFWIRLWAIAIMLIGTVGSAFIVAFGADVLLSRRLMRSASLQKASHLRGHYVVVGLGAFGTRVALTLMEAGHDVVVIDRDEDNRYVSTARELGVPVILGDATMPETLSAAQVTRASAIAILTADDMTNIETAIVAREMLGMGQTGEDQRVPIVVRIYDRALGRAVGRRLGFNYVRSTVDLATPWFMGAALGLEVLGTFSVGQRSFMAGGVRIAAGSELDGTPIVDLSTQTRVIAIERAKPGAAEFHPPNDTRFGPGDTVYLVGPYRELLATLRKGQPRGRPQFSGHTDGLGLGGALVQPEYP